MLLSLAVAGVIAACSDAGSVDPDAIPDAQKRAVWMALDSAFRHDTTLDPAFTGDSGLYALMSTLVIPFVDRASRIAVGGDTTRAVGIEFDIDATQGGTHVVSNLTAILAWRGYDSTSRTIDTVFFLLGSGRAPITDSLWSQFTLDQVGTRDGIRDPSADGLYRDDVAVARRPPAYHRESVRVESGRVHVQRGSRYAERRVHDYGEVGSGFEYDGDVGAGLRQWGTRHQGEDPRHPTLSARPPAPCPAPRS